MSPCKHRNFYGAHSCPCPCTFPLSPASLCLSLALNFMKCDTLLQEIILVVCLTKVCLLFCQRYSVTVSVSSCCCLCYCFTHTQTHGEQLCVYVTWNCVLSSVTTRKSMFMHMLAATVETGNSRPNRLRFASH